LIGIIGFLFGVFGQVLSMIDTFDSIAQAGDISAFVVADGIKNSYKSTLIGLTVLIISLIIWGILKGTKQKRMLSRTADK
jgi:biopolymer transport protein ExbB/TolQ